MIRIRRLIAHRLYARRPWKAVRTHGEWYLVNRFSGHSYGSIREPYTREQAKEAARQRNRPWDCWCEEEQPPGVDYCTVCDTWRTRARTAR
ncbi:hypothetical protein [Streptomyces syringium]|uniref:hypothetical protein n=1 Tax=Streptomyces syringium TaxID=76729 RepID=UPI0033F3B93A